MIDRETKSRDMGVDWKPSFVTGNIQRHHAAALESLNKLCGMQTLLLVEVPQRAENQPRFNPRFPDAIVCRAIDCGNHCLRRESLLDMQQRGKTNLCVDDFISTQLFEQIFGDKAKRFFTLHELKPARSTREKIGKACALGRRNELGVEPLPGYRWVK